MEKHSLTFLLLLVAFLHILIGSEAASISSVTKSTDISGLWKNLANLKQQRRVMRQIPDDLWGGYSNVDTVDDKERLYEDILQPQAAEFEYDEYNYNGGNKRYRRDVAVKEPMKTALKIEHKTTEKEEAEEHKEEEEEAAENSIDKQGEIVSESVAGQVQNPTVTSVANTQKPNQFSVLILIRDALKKVTTNLPAEQVQVASNALQYFQLFEHFLQQTIEQVIDDVDDEDEENTTNLIDELAASTEPEKEKEQLENKPETENMQMQIVEPVLPIKEIIEIKPIEMSAEESPMTIKQIIKPKTSSN